MKKTVLCTAAAVAALGLGAPAVATAAPIHTAPHSTTASKKIKAGEAVVNVTNENLAEAKAMAKSRPVVFLVTAPAWCGACQQLDPIIHKIAEADGGKWTLAVIDVDKAGGAEREFSVGGYPTMVPWGKDGELKSAGRGGPGDESTTRAWIDSVVQAYGPAEDPTPKPEPTRPY